MTQDGDSRSALQKRADDTNFIHMGSLARPHGIKGELCVDWYADSPALLRGVIYLQAGKNPPQKVENAKVRMHQGRPLILLPHVQDRTAAETLRGVRILIHRDDMPPLPDDEFYLHDILGFSVVDSGTGQAIGTLHDVEFPAGQDVWDIRTADGQEVLFPAVEDFIDGIDTDARTVHISPPEGLLDIYLTPDGDTAAADTVGAHTSGTDTTAPNATCTDTAGTDTTCGSDATPPRTATTSRQPCPNCQK